MSERMPTHSPEHQRPNHGELERMAAERLRQSGERGAEKSPDRKSEVIAAREKLAHAEHQASPHETGSKSEGAPQRPVLTRELSFKHTMIGLRHRMKPAQRRFSQIIHSPAIEAASEVVGKTVLRPSVSLGATTCALLVGGTLYLFARNYGYPLRGSEILLSLVVGGIIGLLLEALYKTLFRSRRY